MNIHRDPRNPRWTRRVAWVSAGATAAALTTAWVGCSLERDYQTLNFFFDGVPDPNARSKSAAGLDTGPVDIHLSATYTVHKPYAENNCAQCHAGKLRPGTGDSSICMKCHAPKTSEHPKMHGPVAAGACLWCHNPHESAFPHLMKAVPRQVCLQCHEPTLNVSKIVPAHADANQSCIDCHSGHGGPESFFLISPGKAKPEKPTDAPPPATPEPVPPATDQNPSPATK